jgi:DNA-binding NarL/FixJ family response regulator
MPATLFKIALRVGLLTSAAIIIFWVIGQFTIYRYLKTEYYAAIIAVSFLAAGILIPRSKSTQTPNPDIKQLSELTQKELSILAQIAAGKSNKEIAAENFVELSTVKTHINNIYSKLGVNNRREAIKAYTSHPE